MRGAKKAKDRITVALAVNVTASKQLKPVHREKNGSNQSFDFIKDFKSSVKSLCD